MRPSSLPVAPWPNPSIERTCSGRLRLPTHAAHVERWAPAKEELACEQGLELNARRAVRPSAASGQSVAVFSTDGLLRKAHRRSSLSHGLSVLRRPARRRPEWLGRDMEALRTVSRGESEVVSAPASGMNLVTRRMHGSSGSVAATIWRMLPSSLPLAPWPNPSIERTCLKPLCVFSPAAHVER